LEQRSRDLSFIVILVSFQSAEVMFSQYYRSASPISIRNPSVITVRGHVSEVHCVLPNLTIGQLGNGIVLIMLCIRLDYPRMPPLEIKTRCLVKWDLSDAKLKNSFQCTFHNGIDTLKTHYYGPEKNNNDKNSLKGKSKHLQQHRTLY